MKRIRKNKVSVVGLGKLGLPFAACFADRGFKTIGIDVNENVINSINKGESPIVESGLEELIAKYGGNKLEVTTDHRRAISETDITFVLVATPSDPEGNFSNTYVESALKSLAKNFGKSKKDYHLFVISSTVMPGSIDKKLIPIIERNSGRKINIDFGVCYVPDFVALGSVIRNFLNPDIVIIGQSDKFAGDQTASIHEKFCENNPVITKMSLVSAEIAKVTLNAYITTKISFVNVLANICEKIPEADVDLITKAIGADKRISPYYFKGGLSFGGTCFPRDTKSFIRFSEESGVSAGLIKEVEKINKFQDEHLVRLVMKNLPPKSNTVSILGLSFKPETPIIVESPAIKLVRTLLRRGIKVVVYDPLAMDDTRNIFGDKIQYTKSIKDCLFKSSCWVIATPDKKFKKIDKSFVIKNPTVIIDCWRILNSQNFSKKVKYIKWGYY